MDDEEWDENDAGVTVCECDQCGRERPCVLAGDPFVDEILPGRQNPESWWCRDCFVRRKDDI